MDPKSSFFLNFRRFVSNPSLENVKALKDVSDNEIHQLVSLNQESLVLSAIFTTIAELKTRNKNEITHHLIETATKIIANTQINSLISMQSMLVILLKSVGLSPGNSTADKDLSEESKLSIITCIGSIFRKATPEVIKGFYSKENLNLVAQILFLSEQIVAQEKYRPLRTAGINCITSVFQVHTDLNVSEVKQRQQVADLVFIVIPKIIATLLKVTTESNDTLIACSVAALGRILHLVFEDYDTETYTIELTKQLIENPMKSGSVGAMNSVRDHFTGKKETQRNDEWFKFASSKLTPSFQKIKTLTCKKSDSVRQELYKFSDILLRHCQRNLSSCVPALLEINVTLLDTKKNRSLSIYNENVIDIIEDCLLTHLIRLPRIIHTGNNEEQLAGFAQFRGFVQLLHSANRLKITLSNENVLGNFIANLLLAVELDRQNNLLEMKPSSSKTIDLAQESLLSNHQNMPWKIFKNIQESEIYPEIRAICMCVKEQKESYNFILTHLSELLIKNSANCNEALVLIQIFAMNTLEHTDPCESIHEAILESLHADFRWKLATQINDVSTVDDNSRSRWFEDSIEGVYDSALSIRLTDVQPQSSVPEKRITIKEVKNNILHMCLVIETIGCYAKKIKEHHKFFHMKSLHRLIEKLASPHFLIRSSTFNALDHFKSAFNLKSISDLIFTNADYVSHSIHVSLKKSRYIDAMLRTLINSMQCSSIECVPNLENIVETLIIESARSSQSKNAITFLNAFELILSSIRDSGLKLAKGDDKLAVDGENYFEKWSSILEADRHFEQMENDDKFEENEDQLEQTEECNEPENEITAGKRTNPPAVDLTIKIVKRIVPYASSNDVNVKLVALECLGIGLEIIKDYENEILPIVHLTWDLLVQQCILNKNPIFVRPCLRVLKNIAVYTKDFVTTQSSSQLLTYLNAHLTELKKKYAQQKGLIIHEYSQDFKTLKEILTQYPVILKNLYIRERDFDAALNAVTWLLNENKTQFPKNIVFGFYKDLMSYDICTVYLKLINYNEGGKRLLDLINK